MEEAFGADIDYAMIVKVYGHSLGRKPSTLSQPEAVQSLESCLDFRQLVSVAVAALRRKL